MDLRQSAKKTTEDEFIPGFFYPLLFLVPDFDGPAVDCLPFRVVRRKWETSTFDLATLATKHKLHLPYQVMDVFLSRCNMELWISGKGSFTEANEAFQMLRVSLYSSGVSPFLCPFVTTHSINDYSGSTAATARRCDKRCIPEWKWA